MLAHLALDAAPGAPAAARVDSIAVCYHCAASVPVRSRWVAVVAEAERNFCCAGCQAVAETLHAAGLDGLYAGRTQASLRRERDTDECEGLAAAAEATGLARALPDGRREAALLVEGLTCGACVPLLESWLARQPGITEARVNFARRRALVTWDPARTRLVCVLRAIAAAGYAGFPYDPARREALARRERLGLLARTAVALLCAMQAMMFALPFYFADDGIAPEQRLLLYWAAFVLTLPAMFYSASPFFSGARRDLAHGRLGMDVPIALGLVVAFAASVWSVVRGGGPVYFDSVTMFIALVLVARFCDLLARQKAGEAIEAIARQRPDTAERMSGWPVAGDPQVVAAATLAAGDIVLVRPGARVPADGEIVDGRSHVEEALLTGESAPRPRAPGDALWAGSLNCDNALVMRVQAAGEDTRLAGILRLSERAAATRPAVARNADRVARIFVAALLLLAAATALAWTVIDPPRALPITFAVLAVSCPCALALATPAALAAAAGSLAGRGVVLVRSDALETLAKVSHVVFDKTGTLTEGHLRVTAVATHAGRSEAEVVALAAAMEGRSEHPLARALVAAARTAP
ncbi:MAG: heavy metal translocating P-type ATPase metal-binding domain-containing protein, partial [Casimicrobiaceae bacterium]